MGTLKMKEGLLKYGTDITMLAETGKLDPVIGREKEIENLIQALLKRRNSNACLVGDAGVGKTAIVEALAIKIAANSAPPQLRGKRVYSIEMARIVDGAIQRSEFEKRVKNMLEEVRASEGSVILFIDDLHNLIKDRGEDGIGGGVATILKLAVAANHFKCICAIRVEEYTRYIERDDELKSMFETIQVCEPSREDCIKMLQGIIHKYEDHHAVDYTLTALASAVDLSKHYMREVLLPGKAINLIDKAGGRANVLGKTHVNEAEIEHVISTCRGWSTHTGSGILGLENVLKRSIIGQDEVVEAVSRSIRRAYVGIRDETKPIGCFLISGPSGVGKTYIAKVVARDYFGSEAAMVRLDMCQFMDSNTVSQLTDLLTKEVRTRPHSLVLFEEIEKAHEKVLNVLLQILDYGRLSDGKSKTPIDFTNTILIMTSNEESKFKAEVVNRFDQVVALKALEKVHIEKILDIMIDEFRAKIAARKNEQVVVSKKLKKWLVTLGYDKRYGARAMKRAFTNYVETILADAFLWKQIDKYHKVILEVNLNTGLVWWHNFIVGADSDPDSNIPPSEKMRWRPPSDLYKYIPLTLTLIEEEMIRQPTQISL